jgi:hypothetical protein
MRPTSTRALSFAGASALLLSACTGSCGRARQEADEGAGSRTIRLDYAPFMKASGDVLVAAFAEHLGVVLSTSFEPDGGSPRHGDDHDVYAVAHGGIIKVVFDRHRQPLSLHYRAPNGCLSTRGQAGKPLTPAEANAQVLSMLRRMGHAVDDTVVVESQLHHDAWLWLGVNVRQTYRGEPIELPKVFVIVEGITGRVCEMRVARWYGGLDTLGPPLSDDVLLSRALLAGARVSGQRPLGQPSLRALRIVSDTLCRVVRFSDSPELSPCLDVVTGNLTAEPW